MCKTRRIDIRVTNREYEMIQNRKEISGYVSLSQFVRDLLLKEDLATYNRIKEIHRFIMRCENEYKARIQG